jgi:hypothetical protein
MKTLTAGLTIVTACLTLWVAPALAQSSPVVRAQKAGPPAPKVVSRARQPAGAPHKASAFAPRPTKQRVFGAPIQPPIVHEAPKKKPNPK